MGFFHFRAQVYTFLILQLIKNRSDESTVKTTSVAATPGRLKLLLLLVLSKNNTCNMRRRHGKNELKVILLVSSCTKRSHSNSNGVLIWALSGALTRWDQYQPIDHWVEVCVCVCVCRGMGGSGRSVVELINKCLKHRRPCLPQHNNTHSLMTMSRVSLFIHNRKHWIMLVRVWK